MLRPDRAGGRLRRRRHADDRPARRATSTSSTARRTGSRTRPSPTMRSSSRRPTPTRGHKGISAFIVERELARRLGRGDGAQARHLGGLDRASSSSRTSKCPPRTSLGEEGQGFEIAMYGLDQGRFTVAAGALRRHPRLPRALGRVRPRARDVRQADRQEPVRPGHDRRDGARLRDLEAARHAGRAGSRTRASGTRARRASPSGTRPSRRSRPRILRSRSTAPTATRPSTGSSGTSAMRARRSSTRARRRSTR